MATTKLYPDERGRVYLEFYGNKYDVTELADKNGNGTFKLPKSLDPEQVAHKFKIVGGAQSSTEIDDTPAEATEDSSETTTDGEQESEE